MSFVKLSYEKVYRIFLLFLSVWIGIGLLKPVIAYDIKISTLLLISGLLLIIFLCFILTKGRQRLFPIIITGVIILGILFTRLTETISYLGSYVKWISAQLNDDFISSFQYFNMFLATIILIPFALLLERFLKLRLFAAFILLACLLYGAFTGLVLDKIAVCFCILFISFVLTELLQNNDFRKKITVCLIPFLAIYMFLILLFPSKNEPYDWKIVKVVFNQIYELVISITENLNSPFESGYEGFGMEVVGFSGEANLGSGNISSRGRNEISLTQKTGKQMTIYLRGNVFDTFNGNTWQANNIEAKNEYQFELLETIYAIERHDPGHRLNYLSHSEIGIIYTGLNTNYLFAPMKLLKIDSEIKQDLTQFGSELRFDSLKGRGTEYNINYYQMNSGQEYFHEMVAAEHKYVYNANPPEVILPDFQVMYGDILTSFERKLKERSEIIYLKYSEKYPISAEVKSFLLEITKDSESDYDKCRALEQTLAGFKDQPFSYTKTPGALPEGKQFLDYFLLESYSGYCTYYATAFTLLARELGLPARYVQGFMVYDENLGRKPVAVKSSMAHAWPEVYFDGVGWISFEPTPGFRNYRYQYWVPILISDALAGVNYERPQIPDTPTPVTPDIDQNITANEGNISAILLVLIFIISIVIAIVLFIFIDYVLKIKRFSRYGLAEQFTEHIRFNLQILSLLGYRFYLGETIHEFKERIAKTNKSIPLNFLGQCETFLYHTNKATDEMITAVLSDRRIIYGHIKEMGNFKYYYIRFKMLFSIK